VPASRSPPRSRSSPPAHRAPRCRGRRGTWWTSPRAGRASGSCTAQRTPGRRGSSRPRSPTRRRAPSASARSPSPSPSPSTRATPRSSARVARGATLAPRLGAVRTIELQSPRTFGLFGARRAARRGAPRAQSSPTARCGSAPGTQTWTYKGIPRWFTEGLASVAAGQRPGMGSRDARAVLRRRGGPRGAPGGAGADPLSDSEALYLGRAALVYSGAPRVRVPRRALR
jgi:hypothetical protein